MVVKGQDVGHVTDAHLLHVFHYHGHRLTLSHCMLLKKLLSRNVAFQPHIIHTKTRCACLCQNVLFCMIVAC